MVMKKTIRTLRADEIECRVQKVTEKGCILLIYKDARVDMRILDETFGVDGWQRTHEVINGNLFCNIEIWSDEKKCWIKKQDVGTESNTEKEKGEASDSFKRAGFNVGIGRELYSSPFIWINLNESEIKKNTQGKLQLISSIKFVVTSIKYDENRDIAELVISDNNGNVRYTFRGSKTATEKPKEREEAKKAQEVPDLELEMAIADIKRCKNIEDLQELWNQTPQYQSNKKFIAAVNVAKKQLQK
jgi:hypothetical protein